MAVSFNDIQYTEVFAHRTAACSARIMASYATVSVRRVGPRTRGTFNKVTT